MSAFVTRCVRCRQHECICASIVPVETRTRFLIIRHFAERSRVSNTGHYARLVLANCALHEYGVRDAPFDESLLPGGEGTYLLFPGGSALPAEPPQNLIVLDGSWQQARRMRQRIGRLRELPTLALPPPDRLRRRLRRPLDPEGMSTIEAIASFLALVESKERAAPLEALFDTLVEEAHRVQGSRRGCAIDALPITGSRRAGKI